MHQLEDMDQHKSGEEALNYFEWMWLEGFICSLKAWRVSCQMMHLYLQFESLYQSIGQCICQM